MNVSRSRIENRLRIRILGWEQKIADQAKDELKRRVQEGTTVEADVLFRKSPADFKPINNWDEFQRRYDELKNCFWRRETGPDEEVLIFLLDSVPEHIIPFICHVWFERMMKGFCETGETRTPRVPCHL